MTGPSIDATPVLRAMGIGGFWGGLISCTFLGWWGVLVALVLFLGSAVASAAVQVVREDRKR